MKLYDLALASIASLALSSVAHAQAQIEFELSDETATVNGTGDFSIFLSNDQLVEGFSMVFKFDPLVVQLGTSLSTSGTVLETIGAEFTRVDVNNATGEAVVGVLVDALPPFDGSVIPIGEDQLIGTIAYHTTAGLEPVASSSLTFMDGLMVNGDVPIRNLASILLSPGSPAMSVSPSLINGSITVVPEPSALAICCFGFSVVGFLRLRPIIDIVRPRSLAPNGALSLFGRWLVARGGHIDRRRKLQVPFPPEGLNRTRPSSVERCNKRSSGNRSEPSS